MTDPAPGDAAPAARGWRHNWLNPRRIRFWAIVAAVLYTLVGFFVVPWAVERTLAGIARDDLGRELRIADTRTNPFLLRLEMDGLEIDDSDGTPLLGFERLAVDFQVSSLFNWAWTFREFHLFGAWVHEERFGPTDTRLVRLLTDLQERQGPAARAAGSSELPRLLVRDIRVEKERLRFVDHVPAETVSLELGPLSAVIDELDTRPDRQGRQKVAIDLANGAGVAWQGDVQLAPLKSAGRLAFRDIGPGPALAYIRPVVPLTGLDFLVDGTLDYRLAAPADRGLEIELGNVQVAVSDLAVSAFDPELEFLRVPTIALGGGTLRYPELSASFETVDVFDPYFETWLEPDGLMGWLQLLPEPGEPNPDARQPVVDIGQLRVRRLELALEDRKLEPPAPLNLEGIDVTLRDVDIEEGTFFPTTASGDFAVGGSFDFGGEVSVFPALQVDGEVSLDQLGLGIAQPYVAPIARVEIDGGSLSIDGAVAVTSEEFLDYRGSVRVEGLDVSDVTQDERLVGVERVDIGEAHLLLDGWAIETSQVNLTGPFARVVIAEDRSTNVGDVLIPPPADAPETEPLKLTIGGVAIDGGSTDFSDFSLPLPFSARIQSLDGRISTVATGSSEPAEVDIEGQVGEFGLARIGGSVNAWDPLSHTDITMEIRNLEVPDYSPYTAEFAGRTIASGRMDLDLEYRIDGGLLAGDNEIVIRDLQLGEKIDNPDALDLPLGLAVALLKDSEGVIDIAVPVEGDVNSPEFKIGGVVMQAIVGLITRVVSAPFRALGALVGVESEEFGRFEFLPGRSDLAPPQREMALQLVEALQQRPELAVEVTGAYDPDIDTPQLRRDMANEELRRRLGLDAEGLREITLVDERARATLEQMFTELYPAVSLETVRAAHTAPPADEPEGEPVFDPVAYYAELAQQVIAAQPVGEAELAALGQARAEAVRQALVAPASEAADPAGAGVAEDRVAVVGTEAVTSEDDDWVPMELGVATR